MSWKSIIFFFFFKHVTQPFQLSQVTKVSASKDHRQQVTEDDIIQLRKTILKKHCEVMGYTSGKCIYNGVGHAVYTDVCNHKPPFILISVTVKLFC